MLTPAVQGEDDKTHDGSSAAPFVPNLFKVTQTAIGSFDVIVGSYALTYGAVQVGDHLVELFGTEHVQRLSQIGIGQKRGIFHQGRPSAAGLMRAELGIEQAIDLEHEATQRTQFGHVLEHEAEPASLAAAQVFGAGDEEMAMFPDEVGLFFFGLSASAAGATLGLAQAAATGFAFGLVGVSASQTPQGVEDTTVDIFDDVEDTELVPGPGPDLGQQLGIEIRAIADDNGGQKALIFEVLQEAAHMVVIVGRDQGEGDWEIAERIGGQEQSAMAEVQFVDAQGAGELFKGPLPVGRHVGLADLPVEAVVEEAVGEIEQEVALEGLLQTIHAHAVFEQAVNDEIADAVGVLGAWFDAVELGAKGLAAGAAGAIFSDRQLDDDNLAEREIANRSGMSIFARRGFAAMRTRKSLGGAALLHDAHTRLNGFHACVLPGLVWLPPYEGTGCFF